MATYFGYESRNDYDANATAVFILKLLACPGSGSQTIMDLSSQLARGAANGEARVALYDSGGTLICQTALLTVTSGTFVWMGYPADSASLYDDGLNPISAPNLTGGADYYLAVSSKTINTAIGLQTGGASGDTVRWLDREYVTAGFPATKDSTGSSDITTQLNIRCGVDPAAGGGATWPGYIGGGFY